MVRRLTAGGSEFEPSVPRRESVGCLALMKLGALLINASREVVSSMRTRSTPRSRTATFSGRFLPVAARISSAL
jgi:hypothetical protein